MSLLIRATSIDTAFVAAHGDFDAASSAEDSAAGAGSGGGGGGITKAASFAAAISGGSPGARPVSYAAGPSHRGEISAAAGSRGATGFAASFSARAGRGGGGSARGGMVEAVHHDHRRKQDLPMIDVWDADTVQAWVDVRRVLVTYTSRLRTRVQGYLTFICLLAVSMLAWQSAELASRPWLGAKAIPWGFYEARRRMRGVVNPPRRRLLPAVVSFSSFSFTIIFPVPLEAALALACRGCRGACAAYDSVCADFLPLVRVCRRACSCSRRALAFWPSPSSAASQTRATTRTRSRSYSTGAALRTPRRTTAARVVPTQLAPRMPQSSPTNHLSITRPNHHPQGAPGAAPARERHPPRNGEGARVPRRVDRAGAGGADGGAHAAAAGVRVRGDAADGEDHLLGHGVCVRAKGRRKWGGSAAVAAVRCFVILQQPLLLSSQRLGSARRCCSASATSHTLHPPVYTPHFRFPGSSSWRRSCRTASGS